MAPFWSGIAIGIMIGVPIFLLCVIAAVILSVYRAIDQGVRSGEFAAAWRAGRAKGEPRRQRDLAWMERHWATRWCARLNRRIFG